MGNGYIDFGTPDYDIAKHLPGYTVEQINEVFGEIIAENLNMEIAALESDEDFYDGF